ncbi:MAG: LytTR family transcriptional regulator [Bacteroidales bacterium]|nr:LytTR family transcriptional regulator [Bacteroidales bacterium]
MNLKVPQYLLQLKTNLKISVFVAIFALLFICVYNPIELSHWLPAAENSGARFGFSAIIILGGIVVIALSRLVLSRIAKKHEITLPEYGIWLLCEVIAIAFAYLMLTKFGLHDSRSSLTILRSAIFNILLMLAIPYLISYLYVALRDKELKIKDFLSKTKNMEDGENAEASALKSTDRQQITTKNSLIRFYDEKRELRLTVRQEYLFYIESSDNYVNIHYKKGNKLVHTMIRTSLKALEEQLRDYGIVRCHRAYLINMSNIKIVRKEHDGLIVDFDIEGAAEIPVSKTYTEQVMNLLT